MIINTAKLLGALFHHKKTKSELIEIVTALHLEGVLSSATLDALSEQDEDTLLSDFTELFEGTGEMKAPPWGSVYLDREKVLFGDSTIAYRQFLQNNGIALNTGIREPEDQFGLMLFAYAYLLENNNIQAANELMEQHLLVWCAFYLKLLTTSSPNKFYRHLSNDVSLWLNNITLKFNLKVENKKIYIDD